MATPAIGTVVRYQRRPYTLIGAEPYTRSRDGVLICLLIWKTYCAQCGREFQTRTPMTALANDTLQKAVVHCQFHRGRRRKRG
jgi:hypothetical protein